MCIISGVCAWRTINDKLFDVSNERTFVLSNLNSTQQSKMSANWAGPVSSISIPVCQTLPFLQVSRARRRGDRKVESLDEELEDILLLKEEGNSVDWGAVVDCHNLQQLITTTWKITSLHYPKVLPTFDTNHIWRLWRGSRPHTHILGGKVAQCPSWLNQDKIGPCPYMCLTMPVISRGGEVVGIPAW